ncbi:MAG: hypothetical protein BIFFINMI_01772 [Phycisphaerae bacterium]|nr:hypothetical protein [Phycisphaerae bacterium]
MPIMQRPALCLLPVILAWLPMTGCDRAWLAYDAVRLGEPVPADNLLRTEGRALNNRNAWEDAAVLPVPLIAASHMVRTLENADGRVQAKCYYAAAAGHWGLLQTLAVRFAVEVRVPPELMIDPPADGTVAEDRADAVAMRRFKQLFDALYPLSAGVPDGLRDFEMPGMSWPRTLAGQMVEVSCSLPVSRQRVPPPLQKLAAETKDGATIDLRQLDLSGIDLPEGLVSDGTQVRLTAVAPGGFCLRIVRAIPFTPPDNVLDYLRLGWRLVSDDDLVELEKQKNMEQVFAWSRLFFGLAMYSGGRAVTLSESSIEWDKVSLAGLSKPGFDWTYTTPGGGTLRITNLGGGRIRAESRFSVALDPFFLLAWPIMAIEEHRQPTVRVRHLRVAGPTTAPDRP